MSLIEKKDGTFNAEAVAFLVTLIWFVKSSEQTVVPGTPAQLHQAIIGSVLFICIIGKSQESRLGTWLAMAVCLATVGWSAFALATAPFKLKWLVLGSLAGLNIWMNWCRRSRPQPAAKTTDKPMISLVLLLSKPRYLESQVLAHIVESAWGGDYTNEDKDKRDGFVVGNDAIIMIKSPMGLFAVHNFPNPYWQGNGDKVANALPDLRLRKIVQDHQAWLSVDLMAGFGDDPGHAAAYAAIIRLLNELADETVLGILRPETGHISAWSDDVLEALLRPQGEDRFYQAGNVPVVEVAANDAAMKAAEAEARRRWPEFAAAFAIRKEGDRFAVKAPVTVDDVTEFIWVTVDGLEPDYVHGELGNDPVNLRGLKLGSRVEVQVASLNDWTYEQGGSGLVGLFTLPVINDQRPKGLDAP